MTNTAIPNQFDTDNKLITSISGDLTTNDSNGKYVQLSRSPASEYGILILSADGTYTYSLYQTSPSVVALKAGEVSMDIFDYQYFALSGESATAKLTITIIGNPVDGNGDTIFDQPDDDYDNVDVEFNNRSNQATPLNSGKNIQGHLYDSEDKDWYVLTSAGDEIITLEVCPKGTNCFGKKAGYFMCLTLTA
ncbi:hypothetical protein BJAS_P1137 [Bathymodiolus japonicus methanotrophic gill symbiont]|uniref:VCBS domain-containing protein n=1 Tax=Bathymodiolus japonicus methanotrophic gill symbiont TaxID=113269 RepID=UPI001B3F9CEA|nr:VCBS domain-containing protein [Bathymodiolus japonicus methanotrophic gill symbiont]GFO71537.1 hypothetical protein BJAS_P1137 [Bathymodiolus japonicus methanotrophic gill symbiont]